MPTGLRNKQSGWKRTLAVSVGVIFLAGGMSSAAFAAPDATDSSAAAASAPANNAVRAATPLKWEEKSAETYTNEITLKLLSGTVPAGASVVASGAGKAQLNDDGSITVSNFYNYNDGDTVTITVKSAAGAEIGTATIKVKNVSQFVNQGVAINQEAILSNGNNNDGGAELKKAAAENDPLAYDLSGLVVTLTDKQGKVFTSGDASKWTGGKGYSVVNNFGYERLPYGDYTVGINYDKAQNKMLNLDAKACHNNTEVTGIMPGDTVTVAGSVPTLFVCFASDIDGDGLSDAHEKEIGTDPTNADTDGDGVSDGREADLGTDPNNPDTDGDGLTDGKEAGTDVDANGKAVRDDNGKPQIDDSQATKTDPTKADTDGDGINDGKEIKDGTNPLDPNDPGKKSEKANAATAVNAEQKRLPQTGGAVLPALAFSVLAASTGGLLLRRRIASSK